MDFDSYDQRLKITRLISDYSINISNHGFTKKSIPFINHAIWLFETDVSLKDKDLLDEPMYETLIWKRGENNYNLKKFSAARKDFKRLISKWLDNDKFKNWHNACITYRVNQFQWGFIVLMLFCLIIKYAFGLRSELITFGQVFGLIGFISSFIYKSLIKI